jgi:hypothetical protein
MLKDAGEGPRAYPAVHRDDHRPAGRGMAKFAMRTASVDLHEARPFERPSQPGSGDLREAPGHAGMRTLIGRTIGGAGAGSSSK